MSKLVLHPITQQQIESFKKRPSHALILIGPKGIGKFSVAEELGQDLLDLNGVSVADHPYSTIVSPDEKNSISIEAVRQLEQTLKLKVPTSNTLKRVVIIEDSHALGAEAQNALLKTLEEPPEGTVLILTAASVHGLLPTILSRAQQVTVKRPETSILTDHFSSQGQQSKDIHQALAMSGGLPGLTAALLVGEEHPLKAAVIKARELLAQSTYERLAQVDELARQKDLTIDVLFILQQMAHVSLQTAEGARAENWRRIMLASYDATVGMLSSGQPKLVLSDFMLKI